MEELLYVLSLGACSSVTVGPTVRTVTDLGVLEPDDQCSKFRVIL